MDCCKDFGVKVLLVLEALIPYTTDEIGTNFIIFTGLKIVVYLVIGTMVFCIVVNYIIQYLLKRKLSKPAVKMKRI